MGESRGFLPEVHDHLHSFERVKLQFVKTAADSQLLNLLSVSRLVTVLDEADQCGVVCKLQELDTGVFRCAVVHVSAPVLIVWVLDVSYPSLTTCCLSVREARDPLTDGGGDGELCQFILKGVQG